MVTTPTASTDWFVAAGATSGDGSREKPFHDPWLALFAAGPGDVIHIAAGVYFGRYDRSSWIIDCPRLTLRGGYSSDFSRRTPWQTPSVFAVFSGYESTRENNLFSGRGDHSGLVLDGLFFDASCRNTYAGKPGEGIRAYPEMEGPIASFNAAEVAIRNCVFANSANGGVELSGDGSLFENNLVLNIIGSGMLDVRSASVRNVHPIVVAGNTFCFAHDAGGPPLGTGADRAIGVRVSNAAVIRDNAFLSCGNAAIAIYRDLDRVRIDGNLFYLTPHDIVNSRAAGNSGDITESNLDELEDLGIQSAAGNVVIDPGISGLRPEWLDAYSRHLLANYATPPREAANALRVSAGLPALGPGDLEKPDAQGDMAPRFAPADALALSLTAKQGAHPVGLTVEIAGQSASEPPTYRPIDWSIIATPDPSLGNQRVELRAGLGFEQNNLLLPDADPASHMSFRIYPPGADEGSIYVLAKRHTQPGRQFEEAFKYTNGREAESYYLLRGVYRTDVVATRQKATLVVESIVPAPFVAAHLPPRPAGRDWFVRAGASGGDGSREKPFRDPFQALEKAEGGDAIHVTAGDYFGKLRSGKWKILVRNLSLMGGYTADFARRDPWNNPTRFLLNVDEKAKGIPEGTILASEENSDGLVVDGFLFDGATYNTYTRDAGLDVGSSPANPLVQLRGGRAPIVVRNCVFLNACFAAIQISCPFGVFENNIVLNTSGWAVSIRADGPGPWTIRNNTILFAADPTGRAAEGKSSSDGALLRLAGRAVASIESNIFAFGENAAVRASIAQQNLSFRGNVFAANLYKHLTDEQYLWADAATWDRRAVADSAYAVFARNHLDLPAIPVDPAFADIALKRLFAFAASISTEEWKALAARIGASATPASVAPPAPKPAPTQDASADDLLASLRRVKEKPKEEPPKPEEPPYCPAYDWKKALGLAREASDAEPGAHRAILPVSFAEPRTQAPVDYTKITSREIDSDRASLDRQPVELLTTRGRSPGNNPGLFPAGMDTSDYDLYSVATVDGVETRARVSLVAPLDSAAGKLLRHRPPADTLRIRGTARLTPDPGALSIVVDVAEPVDP